MTRLILDVLGFHQHRLSWPFRKKTSDGRRCGNYQVCVDCGAVVPCKLFNEEAA